jgi:hypothetical protein
MRFGPTRAYTWVASIGLFLQGTTTLAANLFPAIDRAFPALLAETRMIPAHSLVHIASAVIGFAALRSGNPVWPFRFALLFGLFYLGLAIAGYGTGRALCLGLQPFDHSFHAALGCAGIAAAGLEFLWQRLSHRRRE